MMQTGSKTRTAARMATRTGLLILLVGVACKREAPTPAEPVKVAVPAPALAPKPADTKLWLHIGANVAAYDFALEEGKIVRQAGPRSDRLLACSDGLMTAAAKAFAGQRGYETPLDIDERRPPGEVALFQRLGYAPLIGMVAGHPLHHTPRDVRRIRDRKRGQLGKRRRGSMGRRQLRSGSRARIARLCRSARPRMRRLHSTQTLDDHTRSLGRTFRPCRRCRSRTASRHNKALPHCRIQRRCQHRRAPMPCPHPCLCCTQRATPSRR